MLQRIQKVYSYLTLWYELTHSRLDRLNTKTDIGHVKIFIQKVNQYFGCMI